MLELVLGSARAYSGLIKVKVQLVCICGSALVRPPLCSSQVAHGTAALAQAVPDG